MGDGLRAAAVGGNDRLGAAGCEPVAQGIGVIGLVAEEDAEAQSLDQLGYGGDLAALAGQERKAHQIAQGVDQSEDFRRQSAFRPADRLILSPPFAPLAFW